MDRWTDGLRRHCQCFYRTKRLWKADPWQMSNSGKPTSWKMNFFLLTIKWVYVFFSWIGSINALGAIVGTFVFGSITMRLGCKRTMLLLALPSVLFWILIYIGDTYYYILFARFSNGWTGGGIQTTIILYIAEIADDKWDRFKINIDASILF